MKRHLLLISLVIAFFCANAQSTSDTLSIEQARKLSEQAHQFIELKCYSAAIDCFLQIDNTTGLSEKNMYDLAYCYCMNEDYINGIPICNRWLNEFGEVKDSNDFNDFIILYDKACIYGHLGTFYEKMNDYYQALAYYQKALPLVLACHNRKNHSFSYFRIAKCYEALDNIIAIGFYKQAIKTQCDYLGISIQDINTKGTEDYHLGLYFTNYGLYYDAKGIDRYVDELISMAAKCGDQSAIDFCNGLNINYKKAIRLTQSLYE